MSAGRIPAADPDEAMLEAAAGWHARARAGLNASERAAFLAWLRERPEHAAAADIVARTWDAAPDAARLGGFAAATAPLDRPVRAGVGRRQIWAVLAAGGAVTASLLLWGLQPTHAVFATGPHERRTERLADGTQVWLAPDTRLATRIGPLGRHVTLERGEAAFDVVHQMRGFQVDAGDVAVVDKGTLFTVRHRDGRPIAVTLAHGALRVDDRASAATLAEPKPGEQVEVVDGTARIRAVDANDALAWREGRLIFADRSLADALAAFQDHGAAPVRLDDASLGQLRVSGAYATGDLESFLSALSSIHPVRWSRTAAGYRVGRR